MIDRVHVHRAGVVTDILGQQYPVYHRFLEVSAHIPLQICMMTGADIRGGGRILFIITTISHIINIISTNNIAITNIKHCAIVASTG